MQYYQMQLRCGEDTAAERERETVAYKPTNRRVDEVSTKIGEVWRPPSATVRQSTSRAVLEGEIQWLAGRCRNEAHLSRMTA